MPKPRPSVMKRQREQAKRDKKAAKDDRRAQRKTERESGVEVSDMEEAAIYETPLDVESQ
ncbi:MAG: hypothetical protein NVSMB68_16250 [Thermoanaerobaculia bacterium]